MKRPVFFFHIMKTAGTSLLHMLDGALGDRLYPNVAERAANAAASDNPVVPQYYLSNHAFLQAARAGAARDRDVVIGHYPWVTGRRAFRDPLMATFLRDPVARTLSRLDHKIRLYAPGKTVEELLDDGRFVRATIMDFQTKVFSVTFHPPEMDPLRLPPDPGADAFRKARDRMLGTDFVGLAERFSDSVRLFSRVTGIPLDSVPEARDNVGSWREPPEHVLRRVRELVPRDVELYEMAKERFEREVRLL